MADHDPRGMAHIDNGQPITFAEPERTPPDDTTPDACPHCDPRHRDPRTRPWGVWVGSERDSDGQPVALRVAPSNGAHVAESDAEWLRELIREHGGMPDDTTEGLREQLRTAILKAGREVDENALTAVIEALAQLHDPGDLPARMATRLEAWLNEPDSGQSFNEMARELTAVVLSVRWEAAIQQAAENAELRAEGELSSRVEQHQRAVTRWITAGAEAGRLRAELANRDTLLEKHRETLSVVLGQREEAKAERDEAIRHRTQAENRASLYRQQAADEHKRAEKAEAALAQLRAYAAWCKDRDVEPDERDILALADGTHTEDYVALMNRDAE